MAATHEATTAPVGDEHADGPPQHRGRYLRFGAMIFVSMIVMYGVMFLNTYQLDHVEFSETRFFMTLLMGATMTVIMLGFMWSMHPDRRINIGILAVAAVVFTGALWLVRSQITVDDNAYMRGMIPHHSIAILTSENAQLDDVRVRALADGIIASQCREIAEMKWLIDDINDHGTARSTEDAANRPVPDFPDTC